MNIQKRCHCDHVVCLYQSLAAFENTFITGWHMLYLSGSTIRILILSICTTRPCTHVSLPNSRRVHDVSVFFISFIHGCTPLQTSLFLCCSVWLGEQHTLALLIMLQYKLFGSFKNLRCSDPLDYFLLHYSLTFMIRFAKTLKLCRDWSKYKSINMF